MLILYTTQRCTTNNNQGGYDNNIILQALQLLPGKRNFEINCGVFSGTFHLWNCTVGGSPAIQLPALIIVLYEHTSELHRSDKQLTQNEF